MGRGAAQQQQKGMERADARLHLRERDIVHKYKPRSDRHTAQDAAAPSELSSSLLVISARHLRSSSPLQRAQLQGERWHKKEESLLQEREESLLFPVECPSELKLGIKQAAVRR
jgi:hypothetical protein